jgi:hypothetical protein
MAGGTFAARIYAEAAASLAAFSSGLCSAPQAAMARASKRIGARMIVSRAIIPCLPSK